MPIYSSSNLNTQLQTPAIIGHNRIISVQSLYNNYGAMLLGYIVEAVKNRDIAEQYLIAVFNDVQNELDEFTKPGVNIFCRLQLIARKKLVNFFENSIEAAEKKSYISNKYTMQMTSEQQIVFCGVHWHGKTITGLATELNKPDEAIRKILKECFTIIRSSNK